LLSAFILWLYFIHVGVQLAGAIYDSGAVCGAPGVIFIFLSFNLFSISSTVLAIEQLPGNLPETETGHCRTIR